MIIEPSRWRRRTITRTVTRSALQLLGTVRLTTVRAMPWLDPNAVSLRTNRLQRRAAFSTIRQVTSAHATPPQIQGYFPKIFTQENFLPL